MKTMRFGNVNNSSLQNYKKILFFSGYSSSSSLLLILIPWIKKYELCESFSLCFIIFMYVFLTEMLMYVLNFVFNLHFVFYLVCKSVDKFELLIWFHVIYLIGIFFRVYSRWKWVPFNLIVIIALLSVIKICQSSLCMLLEFFSSTNSYFVFNIMCQFDKIDGWFSSLACIQLDLSWDFSKFERKLMETTFIRLNAYQIQFVSLYY